MARTMQWYLDKYGESHQNGTNKAIHWICVPLIVFSLFGLIYCIPFPAEKTIFANWAAIVWAVALLYYIRLSIPMAIGFLLIGFVVVWGNDYIYNALGRETDIHAYVSLAIFAAAWIGQFIGHKIEGKKPSFLEDVQFLLIGPAWLLHFIYKKLGIGY